MRTDAGHPPYFVSSEAVEAVFDWGGAIGALQAAYAHPVDEQAAPPRTVASSGDAWLRTLPAIPARSRYFGAKLMGMANAPAHAGVEYVTVLFDRQTSSIAAFVDANLVTAYRTAATSAAALDRLAPQGAACLGVLGSGLEAAMHARAFASIRPLARVQIYSPTPSRRAALASRLEDELGLPCHAVSAPEDAVEDATIVLAAARSRGELPILFGDWLEPGATVVSIGSTIPAQREIDVSVVERCGLIVCDSLREVLEESGDMLEAAKAGISFRHKAYSLTDLLRGDLDHLRSATTVAMFKSVGEGLQDVTIGELVLERAITAGLAVSLPISFSHKSI